MSLVLDVPKPAKSLKYLLMMDFDYIYQSFDFGEYQAGKIIAQPKDVQCENVTIDAKDCVKGSGQSSPGDSTIQMMKRLEKLNISSIMRILASETGCLGWA